jgi:clan AA aspartic protease
MITGLVTSAREAVVGLIVRGAEGQEEEVEAIVDTGFNGFLTLSPALVANLALPFAGTTRATLGNGSEVQMDIYEAQVFWDGQERSVLVLEAEGNALLGMSMLADCQVTIEVRDGGSVIIETLEPT